MASFGLATSIWRSDTSSRNKPRRVASDLTAAIRADCRTGFVSAVFQFALDRVLFYGVFGLLLFGPVAFGAVEVWSISILEVGAGLLFVLWATRQVAAGELEIVGNPLFLPMLLFAGLTSSAVGDGTNRLSGRTLLPLPCCTAPMAFYLSWWFSACAGHRK